MHTQDLDELQTHILLKRWIKDTGQDALIDGVDPKTQARRPERDGYLAKPMQRGGRSRRPP